MFNANSGTATFPAPPVYALAPSLRRRPWTSSSWRRRLIPARSPRRRRRLRGASRPPRATPHWFLTAHWTTVDPQETPVEAHRSGAGRPHRRQVPAPGVAPPPRFLRRGSIFLKRKADLVLIWLCCCVRLGLLVAWLKKQDVKLSTFARKIKCSSG